MPHATNNQNSKKEKSTSSLEKALIASEIRYRRLFESAKDGILILDAESGKTVDVNPFLIDLLGYSKKEFVEKSIWEIGTFRDIIENEEKFLELQQKKYVCHEDLPLETADGRKVHVEFVSNVYQDEKKKVIHCNIRDITEKKWAEVDLLEKEKKFKELFDNAPVGYHELDSKGRITWINRTELNMLGYTEEEMIGQFVWKFLENEESSKQRVFEKLKGIRSPAKGEERVYRRKNQITFPAIVEEKILFDTADRIIGIRTIIQDITERKRVEKEIIILAHSLKSINECVSITDLEDKIIFVNESFLETYDYSKNELIGKNINIIRSQNNPTKLVEKILPATLKGGWKGELLNMRKDGSEFPIYLSTSIIRDKNGKPLGLIGVASEITEQKRIENELIKTKERAEESDRLKSAFLANISHEIRTPMNGILGFTQLLKTPGLTGEKQLEFIGIIEKGGARMLNIINDIIDVSKIESGHVKISISETNINILVEDIFNFFKNEANSKKLNLTYKNALPFGEAIIKTDGDKVTAVLTNLVKNALKFTQTGSIELGYERKDKFLEFFVKDKGSGILQEQTEMIFERFRQGSESLTRNYEEQVWDWQFQKLMLNYLEVKSG